MTSTSRAIVAASYRQDVGEVVGWREVPEALGDQPGYGGRHLRTQEEHLIVRVEKLEGDVPKFRLLNHLRVLQGRREDLAVTKEPKTFPDLRLHIQKPGGLRR
jgi:hypothetical protein